MLFFSVALRWNVNKGELSLKRLDDGNRYREHVKLINVFAFLFSVVYICFLWFSENKERVNFQGNVTRTFLLMDLAEKQIRCNRLKSRANVMSEAVGLKWVYLLPLPSPWCCASRRSLGLKSCPVWWRRNQDRCERSSLGLWHGQWKTYRNTNKNSIRYM